MPVIIDGNNLLHTLRIGQRNRKSVRHLALDTVRGEDVKLTVVFDGPPPDASPKTEHLGQLTIRYSGTATADALILRLIPRRGTARDWVVVTDDRALSDRVRELGAQVRTLREWRMRRPGAPRRSSREPKLSPREIADWEAYFAAGEDTSEG